MHGTWTRRIAAAIIVLVATAAGGESRAAPSVTGLQLQPDGVVQLVGTGFGAACPRCELIASYERGLRVALPAVKWQPGRIRARVPDLNQGTRVELVVRAQDGETAPVRVELPVVRSHTIVLERRSELKVGNRGDARIDVSQPVPGCGAAGRVFDGAEIVLRRQRYGEARITASPARGCTRCAPLEVRWLHEPTGYVDFALRVQWRQVEGICENRRR